MSYAVFLLYFILTLISFNSCSRPAQSSVAPALRSVSSDRRTRSRANAAQVQQQRCSSDARQGTDAAVFFRWLLPLVHGAMFHITKPFFGFRIKSFTKLDKTCIVGKVWDCFPVHPGWLPSTAAGCRSREYWDCAGTPLRPIRASAQSCEDSKHHMTFQTWGSHSYDHYLKGLWSGVKLQ